jgi:DNA-3-methyladenine glycosylase
MFGPAGHLYVYFTYGMHFCANAVCGEDGESSAVLLRALAPLEGLDAMRAARGPAARRDRDLCSGPAKLCQAFGIDRAHDGVDLVDGAEIVILDDDTPPPAEPGVSARIGISVAVDEPWRWFVPGDPNVSRLR